MISPELHAESVVRTGSTGAMSLSTLEETLERLHRRYTEAGLMTTCDCPMTHLKTISCAQMLALLEEEEEGE